MHVSGFTVKRVPRLPVVHIIVSETGPLSSECVTLVASTEERLALAPVLGAAPDNMLCVRHKMASFLLHRLQAEEEEAHQ